MLVQSRGANMRRREFLSVLGGATVAWPLATRAQQRNAVRHIGVFLGLATGLEDPGAAEILRPLRTSMQDAGWTEDKNVRFDVRFGSGDLAKIETAADELVALAPELIYATGFAPVQALRQRTRTIPIVFSLVADPVGFGLIESLSRPGGNITGFVVWDLSIGGKWMQLLREIAPNVDHVGIMYNPDTGPYAPAIINSAKAAAKDIAIVDYHTRSEGEVEAATVRLGSRPNSGLIVIPEPFTNANRDKIIAYCNQSKVPTLNPVFGAANRGALLSYNFAFDSTIRQSAAYVDRILRGESPQNLPVQTPTKYELSINLGVAKNLSLNVSSNLLALADQVID